MAVSWPRPTDFVAGEPDHTPEHNRINEHLNALHQAIGTLPEGMEYDPEAATLLMGDSSEGQVVLISVGGFLAAGLAEGTHAQVSLSPYGWEAIHYPLVGGSPTGFVLYSEGLTALRAGAATVLGFPTGDSYTTLPEEGTEEAPHTLATREWVASEGTLLESPNGSLFRLTVADDGTLSTTPVI